MQIPYEVSARPDTGLYNAKVGIWLFLASEVMLFGGLFSSYVFLRIGADFEWPFHELKVLPGFINTMVLIASSVSVVAAWASLKARRYGWYKFNMIFTLLCAVAFMGIKGYEYYGKFTHYSLKFTDGSIISGHPVHEGGKHHGDRIVFEASTVTINLEKSNLEFLDNLRTKSKDGEYSPAASHELKFKTSKGDEITLDKGWFKTQHRAFMDAKTELRRTTTDLELQKSRVDKSEDDAATQAEKEAKNAELAKAVSDAGSKWLADLAGNNLAPTMELTPVDGPLTFFVKENHTMNYGAEQLSFREGTSLKGKLVTDAIEFNVDIIDLRRAKDRDKSLVWNHLPELKQKFNNFSEEQIKEFSQKRPKVAEPAKDEDCMREAFRVEFADNHEKFMSHDDAHDYLHDQKHTIVIPRSEKRFYSNFSPSLSPYYAIYFLMTGLHGLHVVGGAIVLGWFLLTGRKMYLSNPEHLANRVEVGGLFWHFVDLVWIFLFPLYYLM